MKNTKKHYWNQLKNTLLAKHRKILYYLRKDNPEVKRTKVFLQRPTEDSKRKPILL